MNVYEFIKMAIKHYSICQGSKDLYKWQIENNPKETFILHDEPPYANGNLHIDIINRYKVLHGYKVKMRLSIELKALKELRVILLTLDNEYEVRQLQVFHNMMKKGYIHRQNKPVHWFPSSSFS
ncbi:isoleucine--tRNA ligase [Rhizophagus irregularis DAOM 181602=DAOM 197198]|nr:isoleucine--tRNA ligase [Rhizophagus irregularis DAOM 181602=DAOM 197198]